MWSRILCVVAVASLVPLGGVAEASVDGFALPAGFQPEGIGTDHGSAYLGARARGSIYKADLRTGKGRIISAGRGTPSLGMKVHRGRLFVAGGTGGDARVIDTRTGK